MAITINGSGSLGGVTSLPTTGLQLADSNMPAGSVLQVVSTANSSQTITSSTSYVAVTGLSASITPSSTSNKIFALVNLNMYWATSNEFAAVIYRNGSAIVANDGLADAYNGSSDGIVTVPLIYLDSPSSTSSLTYSVYIKRTQGSGNLYSNIRSTTNTITLMEIAG